MNVYRMSWSWYEDHQYHLFTHKKSSQKKFEKDVTSLIRKYGNRYMNQETSWISAPRWIEFVAKKLPALGYKPVKIIGWNFFGASIIRRDRFGSKTRDEELEGWGKIIGPKLMAKAFKKNSLLQRKMNRHVRKFKA